MKGQHGGTKVRLFVSPVKLPVEQVTATSSTSILTSIVDPSLKLTWELFPSPKMLNSATCQLFARLRTVGAVAMKTFPGKSPFDTVIVSVSAGKARPPTSRFLRLVAVNVTMGSCTECFGSLLRQQPELPGIVAVGLKVFQPAGQQSDVQVGRLSK